MENRDNQIIKTSIFQQLKEALQPFPEYSDLFKVIPDDTKKLMNSLYKVV